ncbi:MAG: hypothetical protein ACLFNZ_05530 [Spirochaetaceae bacterium]
MNRKAVLLLFLLTFLIISIITGTLGAQETQETQETQEETDSAGESDKSSLLQAYQRNFVRVNLSTKIQILQDAGENEEEQMGELYVQALDFYLDNIGQLQEDATANELAKLAAQLIGENGYREGISRLWHLFENSESTDIRVTVMHAFGNLLEPEDDVRREVESWLERRNNNFREGKSVNEQVVGEAVNTLGKIGSPSSFPSLFTASMIGYSRRITENSLSALDSLEGDISGLVIDIIEEGYPDKKLRALEWAMEREDFTREELGKIASSALDIGFKRLSSQEETKKIRELRYRAAIHLTRLEWSDASSLAVQHFNQTVTEMDTGTADDQKLLEAVDLLGAMGTHEAAVRLSLYLEVVNSNVENGRKVNEQVVLAVIKNLGKLGDNVAFDHLLLVRYLDYPRRIKEAAREVLRDLR